MKKIFLILVFLSGILITGCSDKLTNPADNNNYNESVPKAANKGYIILDDVLKDPNNPDLFYSVHGRIDYEFFNRIKNYLTVDLSVQAEIAPEDPGAEAVGSISAKSEDDIYFAPEANEASTVVEKIFGINGFSNLELLCRLRVFDNRIELISVELQSAALDQRNFN